jgi:hypothetical protein
MRFDIEEEHFTVFNLLLLLFVWAISCQILVSVFHSILPRLISTLLVLSAVVMMVSIVIITLYITIVWIRHHNLGWWFLIGLIVLFILSYGLESTIRNIFIREQILRQEMPR